MDQLAQLETDVFRSQRAPRQITFTQWRQKVDKKEADIRHQRQRMRRELGLQQGEGGGHEEWVKRKKEEALRGRGGGSGTEWEKRIMMNADPRHKKSVTVTQC